MKKVIIMGAGPAGLAAGYHLQKNNVSSTLFEAESEVGGISKTVEYKGYYFDLGGHRFFTKIDEVNQLWDEVLGDNFIETPRLSRIYYNNKFFNYPLTAMNALFGMGLIDTAKIITSYLYSKLFPTKKEETFEEWVTNRFGKKLYSIFFKTYTEKVWGIPCNLIQAEWAAQRIKGLSLSKAIKNALFKSQNNKIKTLIDKFYYPKYGPGMMYTQMSNKIEGMNGQIKLNCKVIKINHQDYKIQSIEYLNENGSVCVQTGTHFISSIPLTQLVQIMNPPADSSVLAASQKLTYRSVITIDIIINKRIVFPDNWIYIHSPEVKLGRIQNFKNWSSFMVPNKEKTSLGLEYFSNENDELWKMSDEKLLNLAASEIEKLNICKASEIEDYTIIRVPKAYPVYMKGYAQNVTTIKNYIKKFTNLQVIGRYGLFKYNNMDHSILTGLHAAKNIISPEHNYQTWDVNSDDEYHEEKVS